MCTLTPDSRRYPMDWRNPPWMMSRVPWKVCATAPEDSEKLTGTPSAARTDSCVR